MWADIYDPTDAFIWKKMRRYGEEPLLDRFVTPSITRSIMKDFPEVLLDLSFHLRYNLEDSAGKIEF